MKRLVSLITCCVALAGSATAAAAPKTSVSDVEDEVMCPTCGTALSLSESPLATRMRALIQRLADDGASKDQIKARLVDEFGPQVLAAPPRQGFSLMAYVVPLAGVLIVVASVFAGAMRRRPPPGACECRRGSDRFAELVDADLVEVGRRPRAARPTSRRM